MFISTGKGETKALSGGHECFANALYPSSSIKINFNTKMIFG